jgi:dTDP-4-dehydrorhamnose 3,5-epimerase-like enzyme
LVHYKVDAPYVPAAEKGVRFDDPALGIDWGVSSPVVSDKDLQLPLLQNLES